MTKTFFKKLLLLAVLLAVGIVFARVSQVTSTYDSLPVKYLTGALFLFSIASLVAFCLVGVSAINGLLEKLFR